MLVVQWKGNFFLLILIVKREKWLTHDWSLGCLPTVYGIEKLFFCNNDVSFQDSWRGIYRKIKGQELKWNKERSLARSTGRTFISAWLGQFQQLLKTCVIYWSLILHAMGLPMQICQHYVSTYGVNHQQIGAVAMGTLLKPAWLIYYLSLKAHDNINPMGNNHENLSKTFKKFLFFSQ